MDEITLFKVLQPPPAATPQAGEAIRARLATAMTTPPAPGRPRRRPLIPAVAPAGAVVATAALVLTSPTPAWAVTRPAHGAIVVTIHEMRDPAGLQRALRAEGVPAAVSFTGDINLACHPYRGPVGKPVLVWRGTPASPDIWVIHLSRLPRGAGVQLARGLNQGLATVQIPGHPAELFGRLVQASPQCTGS